MFKSSLALAVLALTASQAHAGLTVFNNVSTGYAVSGDGQWATFGTGASSGGSDVFLWSAATNSLTDIGGYAGTAGRIVISADGSTIAATNKDADGYFSPAVYNANKGSWSPVPALNGRSGNSTSSVWSISADGRYVGGLGYVPGSGTAHGFVTDTLTGAVTDLGTTQARIQGIGPDAQVLIGYTGSAQAGAIWNRNADGTYALTTLKDPNAPTAGLNSTAALSGNGLWAAGNSFNGLTNNPYRVNTQTGEVQYFNKIGTSIGVGKITASVGSISADGNTVVGIEAPQAGASFGFIWKGDGSFDSATHTLGGTTMLFDDYLASYGIDTDNHYNFVSIIGMSADATVFSGIAVDNLTGVQTSFVVSVPEPSTYALLASGMVLLAGVARRRRSRV
ncbi:MAG TPA: PEP-CTERM sorting domain-containing protein [Burkholderiaceae bacterium]|jgi:hypothetical protein